MNIENIEKLKDIELDLFHIFLDICDKEGLEYFLAGGSCLGAVRHKGFIPWDDDIDVIMPRPDYDRFVTVAQSYLEPKYFLQTNDTDPEYVNNFAKIRNSETTFVEKSCRKLKINHGIYIDIFPLDGGGDSYDTALDNLVRMKNTNRGIALAFDLPQTSLIKKTKYLLIKVVFSFGPSIKTLVKRRDAMYRTYNYDSSEWVANYGGAWGQKEIMPKAVFGKGTEGEFEGLRVRLPQNYDEYLSRMYGDYMTPPPKDKQAGHHYCTVIDPDKSYKEYVKGIK